MATKDQQANQTLVSKAKIGWSALSMIKKIIIGSILLAAIIGILVYGLFLSKKDYVTLYSNLDIATAGEIKVSLEESGITDYKIGDGGTSILVPQNQVDRLRMDLAVNGLTPESGTGFELFNNSQLGMTEQERQIMYQRALEGELRRSIISLDAVEDARVHLNISEESVFSRVTDPSSASVVLSLKRNGALSESQVQGIIALISGAVHNLSPEYIQVIDTLGNLLSQGQGTNYQSGEVISQELEYEMRLEEKLQSQLGKVLGYDKIAVSVRVTLNKNSEEQRSETYSDGAVVSEQTQFNRTDALNETADSNGPLDNNMQNVIESGSLENALEDSSIVDFNQTTNYQPSVTETHTVKPPGEIETLSVSVIYSGEMNNDLYGLITDHVASIVGTNMERGDRISVAGIPFSLPSIEEPSIEIMPLTEEGIFKFIVMGILALIVLLVILAIFKKLRPTPYHDEFEEDRLDPVYEQELKEAMKQSEFSSQDPLARTKEVFKKQAHIANDILKIWINDEKTDIKPDTQYQFELDGIDKAASLLIVLGKEMTVNVMKHLSQDQVTKVVQAISGIRLVSKEQATSLLEEFLKMVEAHQYLSQGGYEFAKETLTHAMGVDAAEELLRKMKGSIKIKRPFDSLKRMDTAQLLNILMEEHPQTIALVLCYLPTDKAAKVIAELPESLQADVTQRIGLMNHTSSHIIQAVEEVIETRLQGLVTGEMTQIGGLNTVVDILNSVDRSTQKHIISNMHHSNATFAEEVRDNLFTFEDIVNLDSVAMQRVIRDVDQSTLALALKGVSEVVMNSIFKNVSARAAERLKEEIDYLGPVRLSEVEKAQHEIVTVIRRLEDAGEIMISNGGDNDVVY